MYDWEINPAAVAEFATQRNAGDIDQAIADCRHAMQMLIQRQRAQDPLRGLSQKQYDAMQRQQKQLLSTPDRTSVEIKMMSWEHDHSNRDIKDQYSFTPEGIAEAEKRGVEFED